MARASPTRLNSYHFRITEENGVEYATLGGRLLWTTAEKMTSRHLLSGVFFVLAFAIYLSLNGHPDLLSRVGSLLVAFGVFIARMRVWSRDQIWAVERYLKDVSEGKALKRAWKEELAKHRLSVFTGAEKNLLPEEYLLVLYGTLIWGFGDIPFS